MSHVVQKELPGQRTLFCGDENTGSGREIGKNEETNNSAYCSTEIEDDTCAEKYSRKFGKGHCQGLTGGSLEHAVVCRRARGQMSHSCGSAESGGEHTMIPMD